ncbi:oogenesis-related [Acanthochromis polyacanthus]|uniref:oogenesis-related n=1 Tax=Acanthochromis polyacanthus TaxID=80966 RepID=UPI0022340A21|nr:oogenesis-related [Acanthochromis polyacanthus]
MTTEVHEDAVEQQQQQQEEDRVVRTDGVLRSVLRGLLWPLRILVRGYRGFWWMLGYRQPQEIVVVTPVVQSPSRHSLTGRKRLRRITRLLLSILPWCVQGFLGYPVASRIGLSLSPEIRGSPTKPCGKGSKRKQDELDEDEDEEEQPTWVEALSQDLADDEGPDVDPDFEPSTIETDTEEYNLHNDTESDFEVPGKGIVIEDVKTDAEVSTSAEDSVPAV